MKYLTIAEVHNSTFPTSWALEQANPDLFLDKHHNRATYSFATSPTMLFRWVLFTIEYTEAHAFSAL